MKNVDLVIIGGGPAGLAAAVAARKSGVQDILILERDGELGGILTQLIHHVCNQIEALLVSQSGYDTD